MYKELIIIVIIITLVITGDVITQKYTEDCVKEINDELAVLRENILKDSSDENIKIAMNKIEESWEGRKQKLVLYLEHDELEKVSVQLADIRGKIDVTEIKEGISEIDKCVFLLNHVKEKEKFNIKNIF